jgi:hypothetical protein
MAKLVIGGRSFEIAPYDIDEMILAAENVDSITSMSDPSTFSESLEAMKYTVGVLIIGLQKIDPSLTITSVIKMSFPHDFIALTIAMQEVLAEFGLEPSGEAKAPATKKRKVAGAYKRT